MCSPSVVSLCRAVEGVWVDSPDPIKKRWGVVMKQMEKVEIKRLYVRYLRDHVRLVNHTDGEWVGVECPEDINLKAGKIVGIRLGFASQLPEGYEAIIKLTSNTAMEFGIIQANGVDVVSCKYGGEWLVTVYATRDVCIPKGTKICKFRLIPRQVAMNIVGVDDLSPCCNGEG